MVRGGMTLVKYLLFIFNFIFWISGIGIIVLGAWIQIRSADLINILGSGFLRIPVLLIVVGCIIAIVGFFGCCGAVRESYCMTMTFAVLLGVIFILELAAGIAAYVLQVEVGDVLKDHVMLGMNLYNQSGAEGVTDTWNRLQVDFTCCGGDGYTQWGNVTVFKQNYAVPSSCCIKELRDVDPDCTLNARESLEKTPIKIYTEGCIEKIREWVVINAVIVGSVACSVAVIQVLGICFACCLSKSILKEYEEYYY